MSEWQWTDTDRKMLAAFEIQRPGIRLGAIDYGWLVERLTAAVAELQRRDGREQALQLDNKRMRKELTRDDRMRHVAAGVARDCAVVFGSMSVGARDIEALIAERMDYWLTPGPTTPVCATPPTPAPTASPRMWLEHEATEGARASNRSDASVRIAPVPATPRCTRCGLYEGEHPNVYGNVLHEFAPQSPRCHRAHPHYEPCEPAEAPAAAAGERRCAKCGGSGYAPGCSPSDRERGDLWACSGCAGEGWVEVELVAPESAGPIDAKALGKRIADEVMAAGLVDRLMAHGEYVTNTWAVIIADECERQISAELARLRGRGEQS